MAFQITEVQKALKGVDYPASKDDLASHAEGNGADRDLVEALRGMDKNSFDGLLGLGAARRRSDHRRSQVMTRVAWDGARTVR